MQKKHTHIFILRNIRETRSKRVLLSYIGIIEIRILLNLTVIWMCIVSP